MLALALALAAPTRDDLAARAKELKLPHAPKIAADALAGARLVPGGDATVGARLRVRRRGRSLHHGNARRPACRPFQWPLRRAAIELRYIALTFAQRSERPGSLAGPTPASVSAWNQPGSLSG